MTSWKADIPADLPRQQMLAEAIRRGTVRRRRRKQRGAAAAGGAALLATVMIALTTQPFRSEPSGREEADLDVGVAAPPSAPARRATPPSPPIGTGGRIAFIRRTGPEDPAPKVYVMDSDGRNQQELAATTRGTDLTWSPDGTRFAFTDLGGIYVMNADGTGEKRLSSDPSDTGPTWSPDGRKIAFQGRTERGRGIYEMNDDGSDRKRLTDLDEVHSPAWSPDGKRIAFGGFDAEGRMNIEVINADGSGRRTLARLDGYSSSPAWSPDGSRIVFRNNSELWVVSADGTGPRSLVSPGGTAAINPQGSGANKLSTSGGDPNEPSWSPDGTRIAYTLYHSGTSCSIWLMNADGSGQTRLTDGSSCDVDATWEPVRP